MLSPRGGSSFLLSLRWLCGSPSHLRRLGWGLLVGWGFSLAFFPIVYCAYDGDEINTKSRGGGWRLRLGGDVGADCQKNEFSSVSPPPSPTVMHGMTPSSATVKKAAFGRSKSPAFAGTKTTAYWRPLSKPFPMGWGFYAVLGANLGNSYRGR